MRDVYTELQTNKPSIPLHQKIKRQSKGINVLAQISTFQITCCPVVHLTREIQKRIQFCSSDIPLFSLGTHSIPFHMK